MLYRIRSCKCMSAIVKVKLNDIEGYVSWIVLINRMQLNSMVKGETDD